MSNSTTTAKLSADASDYKSVLTDAANFTGGIAGKIGHHFSNTRFLAHALSTALALDIHAIAENVARFITGVTKEAEEQFKQIAEIGAQATDAEIKYQTSKLSLYKQYKLLLGEIESLEKKRKDNPYVTEEQRLQFEKDRLALVEKQRAADEVKSKLDATNAEKRKKADEEHAKDEKVYSDFDKSEAERKAKDAIKNKSLTEQLADAKKKDAFEQKNLDEQIVETQKDIYDLEAKIKKEGAKSNEGLKDGIILLEKQKLLRGLIKKEVEETVQADASNIAAWTGFIVSVTSSGRGNKDLSDKELARKIATTREDISQREIALRQQSGVTGSSPYDVLLDPQRSNLEQALNEMQLRSDVRRNALAFGQDRAFQMNNGLSESRFQQILSGASPGDQKRLADAMEKLNRHFDRGVPFVFAPSTGTPQGQITPTIPRG